MFTSAVKIRKLAPKSRWKSRLASQGPGTKRAMPPATSNPKNQPTGVCAVRTIREIFSVTDLKE